MRSLKFAVPSNGLTSGSDLRRDWSIYKTLYFPLQIMKLSLYTMSLSGNSYMEPNTGLCLYLYRLLHHYQEGRICETFTAFKGSSLSITGKRRPVSSYDVTENPASISAYSAMCREFSRLSRRLALAHPIPGFLGVGAVQFCLYRAQETPASKFTFMLSLLVGILCIGFHTVLHTALRPHYDCLSAGRPWRQSSNGVSSLYLFISIGTR